MKPSALLLTCASIATGCAPLTFSEPGSIDFSRYQSVLVQGDLADYLAGELEETSGFSRVELIPSRRTDLVLSVAVAVAEDTSDGDGDLDYTALASYLATTPSGVRVDRGSEEDMSDTPWEASEDAVDEIALHFIRPFRF